jgi:formylglycine-generating enzyme required for sulfatase activity
VIRLIPLLVGLLHSDLTPPERTEAGGTLAQLGDPRFRTDACSLLNEELLGFVEIPGGPFFMGNNDQEGPPIHNYERPFHEVTLVRYYMFRFR